MSFAPSNPLEMALVDFRSGKLPLEEFIPVLMESTVYVPSETAMEDKWEDYQAVIFPRGDIYMIACFTSPERSHKYADSFNYLITVRMMDYLRALRVNAGVVINPGHEVGYELFQDGIAELVRLAGIAEL